MKIIFIAALGAAAVAVALTLLPLVPSIIVATLGTAAIIGGCGLFANSCVAAYPQEVGRACSLDEPASMQSTRTSLCATA